MYVNESDKNTEYMAKCFELCLFIVSFKRFSRSFAIEATITTISNSHHSGNIQITIDLSN